MTEERYLSLDPDKAESVSILADVDAKIHQARFVLFAWPKKSGEAGAKKPQPTLHLVLLYIRDTVVAAYNHYISCGDSDFAEPSADGKKLVPKKSNTGANNSTNLYQFLKRLKDLQFPTAQLYDISGVEGLIAYWVQVEQPVRSGLIKRDPKTGDPIKPSPLLLPGRLIALPGQAIQHPLYGAVPPIGAGAGQSPGGPANGQGFAFPVPVGAGQVVPFPGPVGNPTFAGPQFPGFPVPSGPMAAPGMAPAAPMMVAGPTWPGAPTVAPPALLPATAIPGVDPGLVESLRARVADVIRKAGGAVSIGDLGRQVYQAMASDPNAAQYFPIIMNPAFIGGPLSSDGQVVRA